MAHRPPHNPGSPKFQDRHLEPRSPTQRQTNLSDMLVYVRDLDNPSHRQRSKEAAYNAVTHTQWASTIYYTNGRDRDLWAGSPDALEFMKDYDRLVTTAKDLTQKVSWFERTFETQDHVDWISPAFRDMLGQANVQGRPKRALFQDVTQLVRNWTGVRFRNLDHCLNDDIVWRDIPNIHRHFGQHGSEQGNVLVHNSDIVMDAMLCRAPDFISGHQNADSQRMTALFQWLTRLPPDVALDIGKYRAADSPQCELFQWIENYINCYQTARSRTLEAIRNNRIQLTTNRTLSAADYNQEKRPFLDNLNNAYLGVVDTVTNLVRDRRNGPTISRQSFDTLVSRVLNLNQVFRQTRLLDRLKRDPSFNSPNSTRYLGTGNNTRANWVLNFPPGLADRPPQPEAHTMHDGDSGGGGGDGGGGGGGGGGRGGGHGGGRGGGRDGGHSGGRGGGGGGGRGGGRGGQGGRMGGSRQNATINRFAALVQHDDMDTGESAEEEEEEEEQDSQTPDPPSKSTETTLGDSKGKTQSPVSTRPGSRAASPSIAGSHSSSGDSVFGSSSHHHYGHRLPHEVPLLGTRNYSKSNGRIEKPRQRQDRSRKIDIEVMLLSTWRSRDIDADAAAPRLRSPPRPRKRKPSWRGRWGGFWVTA